MNDEYPRSAWCETCIQIDGQPIDFDSFPWVVKPLDSDAKRIAIRKGAQIGFSTALCVCRPIFDVFHNRSVLVIQPREIDAKDFQSKLIQVIDDLPSSMTDNVKARAGLIQFPDQGTRIYIRSSGSRATGIRSLGVDTVIVDEASAVKMQAFTQAMSRLDASKSKCFIALSTPTYPGTPISEQFIAGDQQLWMVTCEHCGEPKPLDWETSFQLYPDAPERSFIRCPACNYIRPENKRLWRAGWKPTAIAPAGVESYGVSQLVSHRVENKEIAEKAIAANRDVGGMKTFYNDQLGLEWIPNDSNRLHLWEIKKCIRPFANASVIPRDTSVMHLLAVDQGSIRSSFLVAKVEFPIGSNRHPVDCALMTLVAVGTTKESDWDAVRELQRDYCCWVTVADRAGSSKVLAQEFARSSRAAPTWLAQYVEDNSIAEFRESETASYPLVLVNRNWELAQYQQRFKQRKIALPNDLEESVVQQFANTMLEASGRRFVALGEDHYAHCCGYLEVALRLAVKHFSSSIRFTRRAS